MQYTIQTASGFDMALNVYANAALKNLCGNLLILHGVHIESKFAIVGVNVCIVVKSSVNTALMNRTRF